MQEEEKTHLDFWNSVEKTDPLKTKKATKGALTLTAINATSQIKRATEMWGMYGSTWGLKNISYSYIDIEQTKLACISCEFYYPLAGSFPINSSLKMAYMTNGSNSYLKVDDDFMKKLETDVTTKALSKLGFNADVFMGLYDDNKYLEQMREEFHPTPPVEKKPLTDESAKLNLKNRTPIEKLKEVFDLTEEQAVRYTTKLNESK